MAGLSPAIVCITLIETDLVLFLIRTILLVDYIIRGLVRVLAISPDQTGNRIHADRLSAPGAGTF